jgi:hypothetical protein
MAPTARRIVMTGSLVAFLALTAIAVDAAPSAPPGPEGATSRLAGSAQPVVEAPGTAARPARFDDVSASAPTAGPALEWSDLRAVATALFLAAAFGVILSLLVLDLDIAARATRPHHKRREDATRRAA